MTTALYTHQLALLHDMGPGHPENPERLRAIAAALSAAGLDRRLDAREPPLASREQLARIHSERHIDALFERIPGRGLVHLDGDTAMNPHSFQCALLAAGAVIDATDAALSGEIDNAFVCMRPPGHHAERERAMGFCLFGNAAAGAAHAIAAHGVERVAIVDFDVHHGNGTESVFRDDPRVLFCSSFQHPFYPYPSLDNVPGHIVHVPLAAGTAGPGFRDAITARWLPRLRAHRPELIIVSAGFDAHRADPLGGLLLDDDDFAWITTTICELADELCGGRLVSTLEGGYDLDALGRCAALHVRGLLEA